MSVPAGPELTFAAVQFRAHHGDLSGSRDALVALAQRAACGAALVVLPEMPVTGYVFDDFAAAERVAEAPDGPTVSALARVAAESGAWIVAGFVERGADGRLYNSAAILDGEGVLRQVYRKTLLYALDERWATPGSGDYPLISTPFGTLGVGICMDMNDPRFRRWVFRKRPDVLAFPTNWLDEDEDVVPYWQALIGGAGTLLIAANTWGHESGVDFRGHSAILAGYKLLALGPHRGDEVIAATVVRVESR